MLTDAAAEGLIAANPLRTPRRGRHGTRRIGVDLKVHRKPPKHLELDEALALLAVTPDEYVAMPLAAMTHGLRRNELLWVHFEWIDWGARMLDLRGRLQWVRGRPRTGWEIRDCKFKSNRLLPLYSGFAALVGRRRQAEGLVFTPLGGDGRPWGETKPAQVFLTDAYEAAGIRRPGVLWHSLRHTYASLLAAGGIKQHEIERSWAIRWPGRPASTSTSCARRLTTSRPSSTRRSVWRSGRGLTASRSRHATDPVIPTRQPERAASNESSAW